MCNFLHQRMVCRLGIPAQQLILCQYQFMHYRRAFVPNGYLHIIITSYDRKPIFIENIDILRTVSRVQFFAPKNDYLTKPIIILTSHSSEVFILFLSLLKFNPSPSLRQISQNKQEKRIILRINKG